MPPKCPSRSARHGKASAASASPEAENELVAVSRSDIFSRHQIQQFVAKPSFGATLHCDANRARIFDTVASFARKHERSEGNLVARWWNLKGAAWLKSPVRLEGSGSRPDCEFRSDVYDYGTVPEASLLVDFANKDVGGGCFGSGFVQEEQMVTQCTDFATYLYQRQKHGQTVELKDNEVLTLENVFMDAWWSREEAAKKEKLPLAAIQDMPAGPMAIVAVNAPRVRGGYSETSLQMLIGKIVLLFAVATQLECPMVLGGLLGCGAFRNNRPLVLALHLLLQPHGIALRFHLPIFASAGPQTTGELEEEVLARAESILDHLRSTFAAHDMVAVEDVLGYLSRCELPTSNMDADLVSYYPLAVPPTPATPTS
mmetsp:Transcript_21769/g.40027  ORF Transcript_21769/g.40027 Transcript_21769/m.40027 type:complete len:371 (-) Transcript_21769:154-1266(-)